MKMIISWLLWLEYKKARNNAWKMDCSAQSFEDWIARYVDFFQNLEGHHNLTKLQVIQIVIKYSVPKKWESMAVESEAFEKALTNKNRK